jgi:hypothetical protein
MKKDYSIQLIIMLIFGAILIFAIMLGLSSCSVNRGGYKAPKTWHCVVGKHQLR